MNGKLIAKSNILSFSHDEITLGGEAHKSVGKDSKLFKRPTIQTPTSREMAAADSRRSFKTIPSENLFEGASSPKKSKVVNRNDKNSMECLYDIKLEYTRFKHTVMKELKKMQSDIKTAIEEVMAAI